MKRKADGWNIVLAGFWNRAIFTPEWVNELLFHEAQVETLLSIMPYLPIVYRNQQVAIEVSTPQLVLRPRRLDDQSIQMAETMAHAVLNKLQDTPLLAVGVNFAFIEDAPHHELVRLFDFRDNAAIGNAGWDLQERRVVRRMLQESTTLNLTMVFDGQAVTIEFNYHTSTTKNDKAREAIHNRVLNLRDASLKLISDVYHLEEERDNG
jgi:hypothetical protein